MSLRYEEVTEPLTGSITINAWDDENGILYSIPTDPGNADYQAYLKSLENAD